MAPRCHWPSALSLSAANLPRLVLPRPSNPSRARLTVLPFIARTTSTASDPPRQSELPPSLPHSRLNPPPDDYSGPNFADKAKITLYAGPGGNGCISFLREAYLPNGPANGGDGGHGGNVYIQAVKGETSLLKLSRRRFVRAGRGRHGRGDAQGGQRGEDVVITVPLGTIVREVSREDPVAEEEIEARLFRARMRQRRREQLERERAALESPDGPDPQQPQQPQQPPEPELDHPDRDKWLLYPGLSKADARNMVYPRLPRRHRLLAQPPAPISLDLSRPTPQPILLAAGGIGGFGNPHFVSREHPRPLFATKGGRSTSMTIELELKLLADVGLVGLPNAGKSTLLRALTNSRTRVGSWAFTTLQPNIGTVVLDNYSGRPVLKSFQRYPVVPELGQSEPEIDTEPRTRFTMADIPGLIEGAHLDKGLGIEFLRHVERARVLAFVIDLSSGNAVKALQALWKEVGLYAQMREEESRAREAESRVDWDLTSEMSSSRGRVFGSQPLKVPDHHLVEGDTSALHIASKPWFVVATKGDLPDTQDNFRELQGYLDSISRGESPHPTGLDNAHTKECTAIPVSAIHGHGVDRIVHWTVGLLDG